MMKVQRGNDHHPTRGLGSLLTLSKFQVMTGPWAADTPPATAPRSSPSTLRGATLRELINQQGRAVRKFFIPTVKEEARSRLILEAIVARIRRMGIEVSDTPLFSLRCISESEQLHFQVGRRSDHIGEVVVAILYPGSWGGPYYVCTVNHGVLRGAPMPFGWYHNTIAHSFTTTFDAPI